MWFILFDRDSFEWDCVIWLVFIGFIIWGIIEGVINGLNKMIITWPAYVFMAVVIISVIVGIVIKKATKNAALSFSLFITIITGSTLSEIILFSCLKEIVEHGTLGAILAIWLLFVYGLEIAAVYLAAIGIPCLINEKTKSKDATVICSIICALVFVFIIFRHSDFKIIYDSFVHMIDRFK